MTWLATLAVALLPVATPSMGLDPGFDHQQMAARPLPDQALDRGTVSVLVRASSGDPSGLRAAVLPAPAAASDPPDPGEALTTGKTNTKGRVFLKLGDAPSGAVRVVVWAEGRVLRSVPFEMPALGGVRLLFFAGAQSPGTGRPAMPPGHPPTGMQPKPQAGPSTSDPAGLRLWLSFRIMAIVDDMVQVALTYTVLNRGSLPFDPGDHGLLLPVPAGAKNVTLQDRGSARVSKGGIMVLGRVPTGGHGLQLTSTFHFPYDEPDLRVRLRGVIPIVGFAVSVRAYPGLRVISESLGPPRKVDRPGHTQETQVFRSRREGFPRPSIQFTLAGLPLRSRARSWLFAGLAGVLLLGGLGWSVLYARRGEARRPSVPAAKGGPTDGKETDAPSDPVEALVRIERDRILGILGDEEAAVRKQAAEEQARGAPRSAP